MGDLLLVVAAFPLVRLSQEPLKDGVGVRSHRFTCGGPSRGSVDGVLLILAVFPLVWLSQELLTVVVRTYLVVRGRPSQGLLDSMGGLLACGYLGSRR